MLNKAEIFAEIAKCYRSPHYFIGNYVQIYSASQGDAGEWIPFTLWQAQADTLTTIFDNKLVCILKARQLGQSWLVLAFALWLMLFRPAATVLIFSRRDDEAVYLLDERLKGMFRHLPDWLRNSVQIARSNDHEFALSNGSIARAFPTTAGDSYTASLAIVDEADLVPDLGRLMNAVKPTVDGGGRMILLSRADKDNPGSEFKRIYIGAKAGATPWKGVFLPWNVRPERTPEWYEEQRREIRERTGSLDDLYQQYPATDTEALAARTLNKRIAPEWLERCYKPTEPLLILPEDAPSVPGLELYAKPLPGRKYYIGVDPAEGNPTSDDSALVIIERMTGEEVALLKGKLQPVMIASYADQLGRWYNNAQLMVERNNHGHSVILWLQEHSSLAIIAGIDNKPGWLDNQRGKTLLYDAAADAFRTGDATLHSFATWMQVGSIEGSTLRAPDGYKDDLADACALALLARARSKSIDAIMDYYKREAAKLRGETQEEKDQ